MKKTINEEKERIIKLMEQDMGPSKEDENSLVQHEGEWFSVMIKNQPSPGTETKYFVLNADAGMYGEITEAVLDEDFNLLPHEKWDPIVQILEKFLRENY